MSETMRKNLLKEFRDRDFIRVCRSLMDAPDRSGITSLKGLAAAALSCGAPRYYVDIDFAYNTILRMRLTGELPQRKKSRDMWLEIYSKVMAVKESRGMSLIRAVTEVIVREPASGFFIEHSTAVRNIKDYNRANKTTKFQFNQ